MKKSGFLRVLSLALMIALITLTVTACGSTPAPSDSNGESGAPAEQSSQTPSETKDTLTVAIGADPTGMDPCAASTAANVNNLNPVYETLVRYDENGEIQPLLATSWERVDERNWRFHLRDDVYFHNGEKMTANDVLYSLTRATGPDGAKVSYIMSAIDAASSVVEDDNTIVIATYEPFPLLGYLPYVGAVVVSEKEFTTDIEHAKANPIGTGPFKFVSWDKNDKCVYVRNEEYWGEKPAYKNLIIRTVVEANSRVIELETGNVDISYDVPANDIPRLEQNPDTAIARTMSTAFSYLGMNNAKAPFDNQKFRLAVDYAIDQNALAESVFRGMAKFTPGVVTPNMKYFDDSDVTDRYDVEKAKALLSEIGYDTTQVLQLWTLENINHVNTCTVLQSMLAEVGINVEIGVYESGTFWSILESGDQDFFIGTWGGVGFPEPDNNIFGPFHSSQIPVNNMIFLADDKLDAMLEEQRALPDGPEREALVKEVQKYQRENAFAIPLVNMEQVVGIRSNVKGFTPTPAANHFVHGVYFE